MPIADREEAKRYGREWWKTHRKEMTLKKAERRKQQRDFIVAAKNKPCADCNILYPYYVMEFDHVRGEKLCNLSHLARNTASWKKIVNEIAKCDVVCRNCHAQRTFDRSRSQATVAGGPPNPASSRFDPDGSCK